MGWLPILMTWLGPNEFGLRRNAATGRIGDRVFRGGVHAGGPPTWSWIRFPATQQTLEFSARCDQDYVTTSARTCAGSRVHTRAGGGEDDPEGSGQDVTISCAFQFELIQEQIRYAYVNFGSYTGTRDRIILLANNEIAITAQKFRPKDFWSNRQAISMKMLEDINNTLWRQVGAVATRFEVMSVDFNRAFERQITNTQVAKEQTDINQHEQQVQAVVQEIRVMTAKNEARVANITAEGEARSKEIVADATKNAFQMKQDMKARMYGMFQKALNLSTTDMSEYFKLKFIQSQKMQPKGSVVVGVPNPKQPSEL